MDNIETTEMSFKMEDLSNSTDVVSTSDVSEMSGLILEPLDNLVLLKIEFN
jgi:hypothetical protein